MRYLVIFALLFLAIPAFAQNALDNPASHSATNRTSTGYDIVLSGGTPPFTAYQNVNGNWVQHTVIGFPPNLNDYRFFPRNLLPNTSYQWSVTGGTNTAPNGLIFSYTTLAPSTGSFGDVFETNPFFTAIEWFADQGITSGCGGGNYCPNQSVTRGQMAVFICRYHQTFVDPSTVCDNP